MGNSQHDLPVPTLLAHMHTGPSVIATLFRRDLCCYVYLNEKIAPLPPHHLPQLHLVCERLEPPQALALCP